MDSVRVDGASGCYSLGNGQEAAAHSAQDVLPVADHLIDVEKLAPKLLVLERQVVCSLLGFACPFGREVEDLFLPASTGRHLSKVASVVDYGLLQVVASASCADRYAPFGKLSDGPVGHVEPFAERLRADVIFAHWWRNPLR